MDLQLTAFQFVTQYGSTGPFNLPLTPRRVNRWLENPTRRNTKRGIGKIRHATFNIYPCFKRRQPEAPALCIQQKYSFKVLWGNGWTFHSQGQKSRCMVLCNSHGYQGNLEAKRLCSHWIEMFRYQCKSHTFIWFCSRSWQIQFDRGWDLHLTGVRWHQFPAWIQLASHLSLHSPKQPSVFLFYLEQLGLL